MKLVHFFSDSPVEYNSANWRTLIPSRALRRAGWDISLLQISDWMDDTPRCRQECSSADLIVLQRVLVEQSVDRAHYWAARKKAIVVDFDDAYQLIGRDNQAHVFWKEGLVEISGPMGVKFKKPLDKHPVDQFSKTLGQITGATMPSQILRDDWSWAGRCWYVPNFADSERYFAYKKFVRPDPDWITLGYGGSMSHVPSFELSGIVPALERVLAQRKNVRIFICGDDRVYKSINNASGRVFHLPYVRWDEWPRVLGTFDIGLAPMARRYDDSRSWIKACEYGLMEMPFVATDSPAYLEFSTRSFGLYVAGGHEKETLPSRTVEWEKTLLHVVDCLQEYKEKASRDFEPCYNLVDVDINVDFLKDVYQDVVSYAAD